MMRRILGFAVPVAVAAVALAGCGSSSSTTTKSANVANGRGDDLAKVRNVPVLPHVGP